jgi:endonuclease-3 related protein
MLARFGHRGWWPGETPFEVCIGAILTQNTAWINVEKAISNLKSAGLMDARRMHRAGEKTISGLIRPAGYFNIKASRIAAFLDFLFDGFNGELPRVGLLGLAEARRRLLEVKGIGPETADSMLLYAMDLPIFVVDAYTKRIFSRFGLLVEEASYEEVQEYFMTHLPRDTDLFNDFHAQIVELGKNNCKKTGPVCVDCPISSNCKRKFV